MLLQVAQGGLTGSAFRQKAVAAAWTSRPAAKIIRLQATQQARLAAKMQSRQQ